MKTKTIHYIDKTMSILGSIGVCACGIYVSAEKFGNNITSKRKDVTCGNCKRSRAYMQTTEQQKCNKCGRIVGCDHRGRKRKCGCIGGK
jgi:hypothetical protein